ncbi:MAG TPA: hypothetical protein VN645_04805 [Steroidobacteraceae bacterium]|nr:hypothetical protein [Steroidobacteraceae bacterium]
MTLSYGYVLNKNHYLPNGDELDVGHTRTDTLGLTASYSPSDKWLLVAGVPYVSTRWMGEGHHGPEVDTGHTNHYWTDLRLEAHYQAMEFPVALAPYVAAVIPTNGYPYLGHSAPGRGLHEYWVGFFAGKSLDEWLPGTYMQLRYNYSFVERVLDIGHDRTNLDVELGYFLSQDWALQLIGSWQWTHGGIDVPVPANSPLFPHHDQLAAAEFLNLTGGAAWFVTKRAGLSLNYTQSLHGSNAHKVDRAINFSVDLQLGRH